MSEPTACTPCLRRSWLLAALGPYIERAATGTGWRGSPELLRLHDAELVDAVASADGRRLLAVVEGHRHAWFEERLAEAACWAICRHDDRWPNGLADPAGPRALIGRGDAGVVEDLAPEAAVAIVGSRRASTYGREVARPLAAELAKAGLVVISGLAFGIDACAHSGALDVGGPTLAVLGCGPDTAYPAAHRSLWRRIAEGGAVISELPPGSTPWRWSFPARNRVIAALAGMTVVVEAAARSGSLVTAELAAAGGRAVGAVPGPVGSRTSVGTNGLLAGGARVVRDAEDVLDRLRGGDASAPPQLRRGEGRGD